MKPVQATFTLQLYGQLPDDDGEADRLFDEWEMAIVARLNGVPLGLGIAPESFSIVDGDTSPDQ